MHRMPKRSAGILLYRIAAGSLEVFLVHPGGPFWKNKDEGAWSIPKGEFEEGEDPLEAAIREFEEETGAKVSGSFITLDPIQQKSGKYVHAWAVKGDPNIAFIRSNTCEIEWPPRSGKKQQIPEVDCAEWFSLEAAKKKINPAQWSLINQLHKKLKY